MTIFNKIFVVSIMAVMSIFAITASFAVSKSFFPALLAAILFVGVIIMIQFNKSWLIFTGLFLLVFLNLFNYSPIGWLSDSARISYLRLPIIIFVLLILLIKDENKKVLALILDGNIDLWLFIACAIVSAIFSKYVATSLLYSTWMLVSFAFIIIFGALRIDQFRLLININRIFVFTFTFPVFLGLLNVPSYLASGGSERLFGVLDVDQLNAWSGAIVISSVLLLHQLERNRSFLTSWIVSSFLIGSSLINVVLSGTRAAVLGVLLFVFVYFIKALFVNHKFSGNIKKIVILIVFAVYFVSMFISGTVENRLQVNLAASESDRLRYEILLFNLDLGLRNPIFGVGLTNAGKIMSADPSRELDFSPHNTYVGIFSEMGFSGVILFLLIMFRGVYIILNRVEDINMKYFLILMMIVPMVISSFEYNLTPGQSLFFPLWISILLPRIINHRNNISLR